MVNELSKLPVSGLEDQSASEILKRLKRASGWTNKIIALGVEPSPSNNDIDGNRAKGWINRGAIPDDRQKVRDFLIGNSATSEIAEAWWSLLDAAWDRQRDEQDREKQRQTVRAKLISRLQSQVLDDVRLTRLPALFETDRSLPLAHAYVELRLAPARAVAPAPRLLELRPTLSERLQRRAEQRAAIRRPTIEALDTRSVRRRLILGAPGAGKSSLLRRVAIDIASGAWETAQVPFFVELRSYALQRRARPSLTLADCACERLAAPGIDPDAVRALLFGEAAGADGDRPGILLVDGLDEIASDAGLVQAVYHELVNLPCCWVVTSRPAGLLQALHEEQRFEMVELDPQSVEALIANWCAANAEAGLHIDPAALTRELERVPGMREMATNPFLLTALCFLKSTAPEDALPRSRVAIYEALQERIARQAQLRFSDARILAPEVLRVLGAFACFLYQRPNGVLQIFNHMDWRDFAAAGTSADIRFEQQILPGRLLNVWHEADPHYHFLHLTLQEHLIAQHLLSWTVDQALSHRFAPAWRSVFRFYGSLLWHRNFQADFERLTSALYQERDINHLSLVTLAEIFADAGIRDTKPWIGDDLRSEIFFCLKSADDSGTEAFIDALSMLDGDWLTDHVLAQKDTGIADIFRKGDAMLEDAEEAYDGHRYVLFGNCLSCAYLHPGRAKTPKAVAAIAGAFWGADQPHALMAAHAYAETATRLERATAVEAAAKARMWSDQAQRLFAYAVESRSPLFVPFLQRVAGHFAASGEEPFSEALSLLADIGGAQAAEILKDRLLQELPRHRRKIHQIEICARAVVRLGGPAAIEIFDEAIERAPSRRWRRYLQFKSIAASPVNDDGILDALDDTDLQSEVVGALADASGFGRLPSETVTEALRAVADMEFADQLFDIAIIEKYRLEAGRPPVLCAALLSTLESVLLSRADGDQPSGEAYTRMLARLVFDALAKAKWQAARPLIERILDTPDCDTDILEAAIEAAGLILADTGDRAMLDRLNRLLYGDTGCDRIFLTTAIGRIELERLFHQQSAPTAVLALQAIAAERDILIFETFWTDRDGKVAYWQAPSVKVFHVADAAKAQVSEDFAHALSRWGLRFDCDELSECAAALIFEPLSGDDLAALAAEAEQRAATSQSFKVYRVPGGIGDKQAARMIDRIGTAYSPKR